MMDYDFTRFRMSLPSRLALAAGAFALGAALQLVFRWGLVPGVLAIAAGYVPLHIRAPTNKPKDQGLEEWRPVSMAEVDRLADTLRESRKLRGRTIGSTVGMVAILVVGSMVAGVSLAFDPSISLAIADGLLFAVPAMFFGRIKAFVPADLSLKMPCFQAIFSEAAPEGIVVTPYLRFDKDKEGHDVPEDIRILVEPKRKPADFVGIQIQSAVNKGPNGSVPYLYSVILTRGQGDTWERLSGLSVSGYEVEQGGDEKYGTIVVRQDTARGGYCTTPANSRDLYVLALRVLDKIAA